MSAQPAENYPLSHEPVFPVRPPAEVVDLADRRSTTRETPPLPDSNQDEPAQTVATDSGPRSGPGLTLRDVPGDWDSIRAVWDGTPDPLSSLVATIRAARDAQDWRQVAMGCWALLTLVPRGVLHLASWALQHPARTAALTLLLSVLIVCATH